MLELDVVTSESYDESTEKFVKGEVVRLQLEHSLFSVSKWEAIWEKPFLSPNQRSNDETVSYIRTMIVGPQPSEAVFYKLLTDHMAEIMTYVSAKSTGIHLPEVTRNGDRPSTITSEKIYYWMNKLNVDMACQHWHLNRLLSFLRMYALLETPAKKMTMQERRALNEQRRREWNTPG